jgi:hypothetical protein
MKILRTENRYGSGDGPIFNNDFDYLLFRQDWGGNESVYFNKDEIDEIMEKVADGEIPLHMNYSILYCENKELLSLVDGHFGCYTLIYEKNN